MVMTNRPPGLKTRLELILRNKQKMNWKNKIYILVTLEKKKKKNLKKKEEKQFFYKSYWT